MVCVFFNKIYFGIRIFILKTKEIVYTFKRLYKGVFAMSLYTGSINFIDSFTNGIFDFSQINELQ